MSLVFSTPSEGRLWIYSCWGWFLFRIFFRSTWYFRRSLIRVCLSSKHLDLDCQSVVDGMIFFKTSIHVCHHGLVFFNFELFLCVVINESRCIFALRPSSSLSNTFYMFFFIRRLFCHIPFVPTFSSKFVLFPCHRVVNLYSCIIPLSCR